MGDGIEIGDAVTVGGGPVVWTVVAFDGDSVWLRRYSEEIGSHLHVSTRRDALTKAPPPLIVAEKAAVALYETGHVRWDDLGPLTRRSRITQMVVALRAIGVDPYATYREDNDNG